MLYESHDDLMDKCNYYLVHDAERRQIAANGYGKVKEFHNFEVRFNEIFDIVFNQKKDVKDFLKKFQSTPFKFSKCCI